MKEYQTLINDVINYIKNELDKGYRPFLVKEDDVPELGYTRSILFSAREPKYEIQYRECEEMHDLVIFVLDEDGECLEGFQGIFPEIINLLKKSGPLTIFECKSEAKPSIYEAEKEIQLYKKEMEELVCSEEWVESRCQMGHWEDHLQAALEEAKEKVKL